MAELEGKVIGQQEMESFVYYGMGSHLKNVNQQIFIEQFSVLVLNVLCILCMLSYAFHMHWLI